MSRPATSNAQIFLSYAAADRERARRVAQALEARQWPAWWDRDIGAGRRFDEAIAQALRAAPAVIVLWSRASVASEWVREEASDAKRRDVLVPVILEPVELPLGFTLRQAVDFTSWDGSPDAPELTTLVDAIRVTAARSAPASATSGSAQGEAAPLARNEDHQTPSQRRRVPASLVSALVFLVLAVGGAYWYLDAYYFEHVEHAASVTKRWGFPEAVGRLSAASVQRRNVSIALIRHGRRNPVDELRVVNAAGNTPPASAYVPPLAVADLHPLPSALSADDPNNSLTITRLTFSRDSNGQILEQRAFARGGRLVYTLHYSTHELGEFKRHGFGVPVRESGISYIRFVRAATGAHAGLDQQVHYLDDKQQPQPNDVGEYGNRMTFNEQGMITERIVLGPDRADRPNTYGMLREVRSYDDSGNLTGGATFDRNGALIPSRVGPARNRVQYDAAGNLSEMWFYDTAGQLATFPAVGAAGRTFTYDDRGNLTGSSFVGPDHTLVNGGPGFARQTIEWLAPSRGLVRFFGTNGRPAPALGSAYEGVETWDSRGLSIETTYRDAKGKPTRIENGCSTIRLAYDDVGNISDLLCLDESGGPTLSTHGYSRARFTYNDLGNPLTTRYFDTQDKPGLQGESLTTYRQEYNEFGKVIKISYLDQQGQLQRSRDGYAAAAYTYDSRGNRATETYFDEHNRPIVNVWGYAAIKSRFDDRGRHVETAYLGTDGRPKRSDEGYAIARFVHDDRGHTERALLLDENGNTINGVDGFASWRVKRNAAGQQTEIAFYDEREAVTLTRRPGSAIRRWTFDGHGRVVERADYDTSGRPMVNASGYSILTFTYDEFGREVSRGLLDATRRPLTMKVALDKVRRGSVAADIGLRPGDVILTYAGTAVESSNQFTTKLELFKGDRARDVTIARDGRVLTVTIPPGRLVGAELLDIAR